MTRQLTEEQHAILRHAPVYLIEVHHIVNAPSWVDAIQDDDGAGMSAYITEHFPEVTYGTSEHGVVYPIVHSTVQQSKGGNWYNNALTRAPRTSSYDSSTPWK